MFARISLIFRAPGTSRRAAAGLAMCVSLAVMGCETPRMLYLSRMPPEFKNSSKPPISRIDNSSDSGEHDHSHHDHGEEAPAFEVQGLVKHPGRFELNAEQDLFLLDAVGMSGGTVSKSVDKVRLTRKPADGGKPLVFNISLEAASHDGRGNVRLVPGDVIAVQHTTDSWMKSLARTVLVIAEN